MWRNALPAFTRLGTNVAICWLPVFCFWVTHSTHLSMHRLITSRPPIIQYFSRRNWDTNWAPPCKLFVCAAKINCCVITALPSNMIGCRLCVTFTDDSSFRWWSSFGSNNINNNKTGKLTNDKYAAKLLYSSGEKPSWILKLWRLVNHLGYCRAKVIHTVVIGQMPNEHPVITVGQRVCDYAK